MDEDLDCSKQKWIEVTEKEGKMAGRGRAVRSSWPGERSRPRWLREGPGGYEDQEIKADGGC